jgi:hypothetical protein
VQQTIYRPEPPLDRVVDFLWVSGAYQAQTWRERVLPTGAEALVIHFGERPIEIYANDGTPEVAHFYDAVMCGVRSTPLVIGTSLGPTVGVRFKPGGARPFFGVPGHALVQQVVQRRQPVALWAIPEYAVAGPDLLWELQRSGA